MLPPLFILAGGRSRRMGIDKLWLEIDGRPILSRWLQVIQWPSPVTIVLAHRLADEVEPVPLPPELQAAPKPLDVLYDLVPDAGPLAGIAAALSASPPGWLLFVPLDMPRLTRPLLDWVCSLAQSALAPHQGTHALPSPPNPLGYLLCRRYAADKPATGDGSIEPFPLLLHTDLRTEVLTRLQSGPRALHRLATLPAVQVVDIPADFGAELWLNLNQPSEWYDYLASLGQP